jgi:hypothetical protein
MSKIAVEQAWIRQQQQEIESRYKKAAAGGTTTASSQQQQTSSSYVGRTLSEILAHAKAVTQGQIGSSTVQAFTSHRVLAGVSSRRATSLGLCVAALVDAAWPR